MSPQLYTLVGQHLLFRSSSWRPRKVVAFYEMVVLEEAKTGLEARGIYLREEPDTSRQDDGLRFVCVYANGSLVLTCMTIRWAATTSDSKTMKAFRVIRRDHGLAIRRSLIP